MTQQKVAIDRIGAGKPRIDAKASQDGKDIAEERAGLEAKAQADLESRNQDNKDKQANRELRKDYAERVYNYLVGYSFGCMALLVLSGFKISGFILPDVVLSVIVGSTAVSAIGLVGFVVNGLFRPARGKE